MTTAQRLAQLAPDQRQTILSGMSSTELQALEYSWEFWRQPHQPPCLAVASVVVDGRTRRGEVLDGCTVGQRGAWISGLYATTQSPLGSDNADIARASEFQHAVQDIERHVDFSDPTFVYT